MMRSALYLFLLGCLAAFSSSAASQNLTQFVNPFVGTDAHGHTFPGATVPFGMVQLSPDTRVEGWDACAGYHYSDSTILGFSHTHLSGTGVADYGDILFVPTIAGPQSLLKFTHENEQASPGYYSVLLSDHGIKAELTATKRVGVHRYTFPKVSQARITIDLRHGLGPDKVLESFVDIRNQDEIVGYRRSAGWARDQHVYFAARFSRPFVEHGTILDDTLRPQSRNASGSNVKVYVDFVAEHGEPILVKVGISSVSTDNALKNLEAEVQDWDFEKVRKDAEQMWEKELGKIVIEGGTLDQKRTFYTALYHAMIAPNLFSDVDGRYRGMDGTIRTAEGFDMYTVFSLWDTFRAEHPLLTIIDQKRTLDLVKSLLAKYDESGILPVWELASNETWCMIGYHSVPVIVDAFMKGIRQFDHDKALSAMQHSASQNHFGLQYYRKHGYIPAERESESVSKTLEYAYDDWCIAQLAKDLGRTNVYDEYARRAQFYHNVFNPNTGFMRAKENGSWVVPFDPAAVTLHYTEANAWQYNFFVPHDINGLMRLHGGKERFVRNLDTLFYSDAGVSGRKQADITGLVGQYAQGNEPSHHVAYLYNYAGEPSKTQKIVRYIMDSLFSPHPAGLCGNDDCGQMSAWYVMSAIGFYQVCPGQPIYAIGSPLFSKATIHLENGKRFVVQAASNSSSQLYVQSATLNGKPFTKSHFHHSVIMNGGELSFVMGEKPSTSWGTQSEDIPSSLPAEPIVPVPFLRSGSRTFVDSIAVALESDMEGTSIFFSLDVSTKDSGFVLYSNPIVLTESGTVRAYSWKVGSGRSEEIAAHFAKRKNAGTITLNTRYSQQYTGGGDEALLDGLRGGTDFRLGYWQGYYGNDLDAVVDLKTLKEIERVELGCLQDINSWIFFPSEVEFSFSRDGKVFGDSKEVKTFISAKEEGARIQEFTHQPRNVRARYVRVRAKNIGLCPAWHKGAGEKAWLFVDEINVLTR